MSLMLSFMMVCGDESVRKLPKLNLGTGNGKKKMYFSHREDVPNRLYQTLVNGPHQSLLDKYFPLSNNLG